MKFKFKHGSNTVRLEFAQDRIFTENEKYYVSLLDGHFCLIDINSNIKNGLSNRCLFVKQTRTDFPIEVLLKALEAIDWCVPEPKILEPKS